MFYTITAQWKILSSNEVFIEKSWCTTIEKDFTLEEQDKISKWYAYIDWVFVATAESDLKELEEVKKIKSAQIQQIATLTDQLNLLWRTLYKLTEWSTDPEIIEARQAYEAIQTVLNS